MLLNRTIYIVSLSSFILFLLTVNTVFAQEKNKIARNLFHLEAFGCGGYGSVNYERLLFDKNDFSIAARIGLSTYHLRDYTHQFNPDIIVPIACHAYYGKKHHTELGLGETVGSIVSADKEDFEPKRNTALSTVVHIGYRYQKPGGGFLFKIAYTPIIERNKRFIHWGGVSVGYAF